MEHEKYDIDNHRETSKDTQYNTEKSADESHGVSQDLPVVSSLSRPSEDELSEAHPIDEGTAETTENNLPLKPESHSNEESVRLSCDVIANTSPQNSLPRGDPNEDMQDNPAATLSREEVAVAQNLTNEDSPAPKEPPEEEKIQDIILIRVDDDAGVMVTSAGTSFSTKSNVISSEESLDISPTRPTLDENALVATGTNTNLRKPNDELDFRAVESELEEEKHYLEKVKDILEEVHASEMDRRKIEPYLPQDSSEYSSVTGEYVMNGQSEEGFAKRYVAAKDPMESLFRVSPPLMAKRGNSDNRMKYRKITEDVVMSSWGKSSNMSRPRTPALGYLPALLRRPLSAQSCKSYGELRLASFREETLIPRESTEQSLPQQGCPSVVCNAVSSRHSQSGLQEPQLPEDVKDPSAAVAQCNPEKNNEPKNTESPTSTVKVPEDHLIKKEYTSHTPIHAPVNTAKRDSTLFIPPPADNTAKAQEGNKKESSSSMLPPLRTHESLPIIKKVDAPVKTDAELDTNAVLHSNERSSRTVLEPLNV